MDEVTVRELRNHGGRVLDRVARGESLIVTRAGEPIAELRPLPRKRLAASTLVDRRKHLPPVDPAELRADVDRFVDQAL